jgi:hypothetical protein
MEKLPTRRDACRPDKGWAGCDYGDKLILLISLFVQCLSSEQTTSLQHDVGYVAKETLIWQCERFMYTLIKLALPHLNEYSTS